MYELLHYQHGQASSMLHSLDIPWGYQYVRKQVQFEALLDDAGLVSVSLGYPSYILTMSSLQNTRRGDRLVSYNVRGNYYTQAGNTTLVQATNTRTGKKHQHPPHKIKQIPTVFKFSNFDQ